MNAAQQPQAAPFGSWSSPVTIDAVLASGVAMTSLRSDGADLLWLESVPDEDGRLTLRRLRNGALEELTPFPSSVRSRVNEYGGGAFDACGGVVAWCDDHDRSVQLLTPDGSRYTISPDDATFRYGDLRVQPGIPGVLAVREQHTADHEPITTIVALPWPGSNRQPPVPPAGEVLCRGADFYANPELSDAGRLAWMEWNHPDMPWDAATIRTGRLHRNPTTTLRDVATIAGGRSDERAISAQHPRWRGEDLLFFSDASGYWNLTVARAGEVVALHDHPFDFDKPMWVLGNANAAVINDALLCSFHDEGLGYLAHIDLHTGELTRLSGVADVDSIAIAEGVGYAIITRPAEPPALVKVAADGKLRVVRQASSTDANPDVTSVARSITFTGRHGPVQAWYYPPHNEAFRGMRGTRPPMIVKSHGGPTGFASNGFDPSVQFWTSRGFAFLDVNYSGSAGFGRAYRDRLQGHWGIADVNDCVDAVSAVVDAGLADPGRVSITGGSAGGYTTLQALVTSDVFSAGVSSYGIGDLELLARDTHKFESRYLEGLVGRYPEQRQIYLDRSPIHHVDRLSTPMLILQGLDDKVVPPNQAESMADAVRAKGLPVALLMFEGEGHGFRKAATRRAALAAQLSFYAQLFRITPADDIPVLPIENLS